MNCGTRSSVPNRNEMLIPIKRSTNQVFLVHLRLTFSMLLHFRRHAEVAVYPVKGCLSNRRVSADGTAPAAASGGTSCVAVGIIDWDGRGAKGKQSQHIWRLKVKEETIYPMVSQPIHKAGNSCQEWFNRPRPAAFHGLPEVGACTPRHGNFFWV